jgi:hypothetical protein
MSMPARLLCASLVISGSVLLSLSPGAARPRKHWGQGLLVELDAPSARVVRVVQEVTENGTIQGTWDYRGATELDGAVSSRTARGFEDWEGEGTVLYKVRPNTLAPEHFYESGDQGTVAVRYIVQSAGPNLTRLRIDAVFAEDSHHHPHPSDGQVENSEFAVISQKMKELEDKERKQREEAAQAQQEKKLAELQAELDREEAELAAVTAKEQQLQKQMQELRGDRAAQVRTGSADLKAAPYNQSKTLRLLSQGEAVTILLRIPGWYRVQAANGEQGWVYRLMLEVVQ